MEFAALDAGDPDAVLEAIESTETVNDLADEATAHIAKRLVTAEPNRLQAFQIETGIIENYRRLNSYTRRIARVSLERQADREAVSETAAA